MEVYQTVVLKVHHVGKTYKNRSSGNISQSIIVRFSTFRHWTAFYRSRGKLEGNIRVRLDLTKDRYNILSDARLYVDGFKDIIKFVYADVNCRLKSSSHNW